jgi:F5/8 type C domain
MNNIKTDRARYIGLPHYIFGMNDSGGEPEMIAARKPGWVAISVQVNPPDSTGDFAALADLGLGVIVRLNNGYGSEGALPESPLYEQFAEQCADFVDASNGARLWIIGNEPNASAERPGNDGTANSGELITPELYARCFNACRTAIRARPGHENDWIIPAAVAPFNTQTTYPGNPNGDWVRYFADLLFQITAQGGKPDALALHTGTHGYDAELTHSDSRARGDFSLRHWHLLAYRDFLAAVLPVLRNLPVFITQAQPLDSGWLNDNRGWIEAACEEINAWNANPANQPIQALCFSRWHALPSDPPGWGISDKPLVIDDFCAALERDYRVRWPGLAPAPDYGAQWLVTPSVMDSTMRTNELFSGRLIVQNTGAKTWLAQGDEAIQIGCAWHNARGEPVHSQLFDLPQNILPWQAATLDELQFPAPKWDGDYTLRFDLVRDGHALGSPSAEINIRVHAPAYAAEWVHVIGAEADTLPINTEFVGTVQVENISSRVWLEDGPNAVRLVYRWHAASGDETRYAGDFAMRTNTPPGDIATFEDVVLRTPPSVGTFILRWDLYEGETLFQAQGAAGCAHTLTLIPNYAAQWTSSFDVPTMLEPNQEFGGAIIAQNTGAQVWDDRVHLACEWRDAVGTLVAREELPLAQEVQPGASASWPNLVLHAPVLQEAYTLAFALVREGITWSSRPYETNVTVQTDAPDFLAQWNETIAIPKNGLVIGDVPRGRVVLKNVGAQPWPGDWCIGYRWYDPLGQPLSIVTPTFALEHQVLPREVTTVDEALLQTPETLGEYMLRWDLVREGQVWLDSPSPEIAIRVKAPPLDWGVEFLGHDAPTRLVAGETASVLLQLKNVGKNIWRSNGPHRVGVGYHWLDASGQRLAEADAPHSALPTDVAPEDLFQDPRASLSEVEVQLTAPQLPGAYHLQFDLFAEEAGWFAAIGNVPLLLPIVVTAEPSPTHLWRAEASHNATSVHCAIDGDLNSFWSSRARQVPGMWFRVTLGEPCVIDGIAFRSPGRGHPASYTLRVSADGKAWRALATVLQGKGQDVVMTFTPQPVLYAQLDLLAGCAEEWTIAEVQVHLSPAWNATASVNNERAGCAIDDDPETAWSTAPAVQAPNLWFQLDLGRVEVVSALNLIPSADEFPRAFQVSAWNEHAGGWFKIAERWNNAAAIDISFAPIQTQYLQAQLLAAADAPWAIREVKVIRAMTAWIGPTSSAPT